jgi:hypothetical protein
MLLPWQLCLGMGATVAGGVWLLSNTRDPGVTDSSGGRLRPRPKTRHDELIETRERVRRQLDILNSPQRASDYTNFSADAARRLQEILEEIESELKEIP